MFHAAAQRLTVTVKDVGCGKMLIRFPLVEMS